MNGDFERQERYGRIPFDYKQILLIHLGNMSRLLTSRILAQINERISLEMMVSYSKQMIDTNFVSSVHFLAELLSPYRDEQYDNELKELGTKYKGKTVFESGREFAIKKLGIIVRLMDRLNLLLEKEGREKI